MAIASLLLVAVTQIACKTAFDIPFAEVPNLRSGAVMSTKGKMETVREKHTLELQPVDGFVYVGRSAKSTLFMAYPEDSRRAELGFRLRPIRGPVVMTTEDPYLGPTTEVPFVGLTGPDGKVVFSPQWVQSVRVEQFSPGKTTGLVSGMVFGVTPAVITIIYSFVYLADHPFSWGYSGR